MLKPVCAWSLYCDDCGTEFEDCDLTLFGDRDMSLENAEGYDWQTFREDGRHYCPECASKHEQIDLEAEKDKHKRDELRRAVEMLEQARREPAAKETGAYRDAVGWVLSAAAELTNKGA